MKIKVSGSDIIKLKHISNVRAQYHYDEYKNLCDNIYNKLGKFGKFKVLAKNIIDCAFLRKPDLYIYNSIECMMGDDNKQLAEHHRKKYLDWLFFINYMFDIDIKCNDSQIILNEYESEIYSSIVGDL